MIRIVKIGLLLVTGALLVACSPHEFPVSDGGDPAQDFSVRLVFEEDMESMTVDGQSTKAESVPRGYRYAVQLFRYQDGGSQFGLTPVFKYDFVRTSSVVALDTTVFLPIDPARYQVFTWVDRLDDAGAPVYDASVFDDVRIGSDYAAGANMRDAFVGQVELDLSGVIVAGEKVQRTLHLDRPVAQLRFVAPEALTFLSYTAGIGIDQMRATLRYTAPIPDGYSLFRDATGATRSDVSVAALPAWDMSGELLFCSDYVFAPAGKDGSVSVEFSVVSTDGKPICSFSGDVPVRRGWTTSVTFEIPDLGGDNKTGGIGISPGFDEEIEVNI